MTKNNTVNHLPCPFCGDYDIGLLAKDNRTSVPSILRIIYRQTEDDLIYHASCLQCGASAPGHHDPELAWDIWNSRATIFKKPNTN